MIRIILDPDFDFQDRQTVEQTIAAALQAMTSFEMACLILCLLCERQVDAARLLGVSQPAISKGFTRVLEKIRKAALESKP